MDIFWTADILLSFSFVLEGTQVLASNISFTNILESSFCILFDCQMMKCAIFVGKQADLKYATDLLAFAHIAPSNSLSPPTLARNMIKQFCLILPESQMT